MNRSFLYTLGYALLPALLLAGLIGVTASPFAPVQTIVAACGLAWAIVVLTELPVHLCMHKKTLPLTLSLRLLAVLMRLLCAVACVALYAARNAGPSNHAFILIFCVTLSLTILVDAGLTAYRFQEPVHA